MRCVTTLLLVLVSSCSGANTAGQPDRKSIQLEVYPDEQFDLAELSFAAPKNGLLSRIEIPDVCQNFLSPHIANAYSSAPERQQAVYVQYKLSDPNKRLARVRGIPQITILYGDATASDNLFYKPQALSSSNGTYVTGYLSPAADKFVLSPHTYNVSGHIAVANGPVRELSDDGTQCTVLQELRIP